MKLSRALPTLATTHRRSCFSSGLFPSEFPLLYPSLFFLSTKSIHEPITDLSVSGAWIVFPTIMVYQFGKEILNGLALAASVNASGRAVKNE